MYGPCNHRDHLELRSDIYEAAYDPTYDPRQRSGWNQRAVSAFFANGLAHDFVGHVDRVGRIGMPDPAEAYRAAYTLAVEKARARVHARSQEVLSGQDPTTAPPLRRDVFLFAPAPAPGPTYHYDPEAPRELLMRLLDNLVRQLVDRPSRPVPVEPGRAGPHWSPAAVWTALRDLETCQPLGRDA